MTLANRRLLLGCYFPRSIELEGVGSLSLGLAQAFRQSFGQVQLLLPEGEYPAAEGVDVVTYRPGLGGLGRYRRRIAELSADADVTLLIENNPNMAGSADASRKPEATFCLFVTPLQTLAVLRELGWGRQGVLHALSKHAIWSHFRNWEDRRVIVASEFQAVQLRQLGARNLWVMPVCGLSRAQAIPDRVEARRQLGWDDRPVVGYLGHYSPAKGVEVLIEAFARCDGPAKLALAHSGKGRLGVAGAASLEDFRRAGRLREVGITDPPTFLAACDVIVMPYATGSVFHQPQALLEALASRTAVITSNLGGFGEIIRPGQTGELFPARDASALRQAIQKMLGDLGRTHQMGRNGRQMFETLFCREAFCERFAGLA